MKASRTLKGNIKLVMSEKEAKALPTLLASSHYAQDSSDLTQQDIDELAAAEWVSYRVCGALPV